MIKISKKQRGVTLIEVMISVAVVAIIGLLALQAFEGQTAKNRRSDAIMALKQLRLAMEQFRSDNGVYDTPAGATAANAYQASTPSATIIDCQANRGYMTAGGLTSCQGFYQINIVVPNTETYTITATPTAGRAQDTGDTRCRDFVINNLGQELIANAAAGVTASECWSQ